MPNPLYPILKATYRTLSRFPCVVRWGEFCWKNIQLRYWPWYRLPPHRSGTDSQARFGGHDLIVSLTSFPARIHLVHYAIYSLLKQSLKPTRLVLWLGEDKFPGREADLPRELLALKAHGLEIRWCRDLRAATKLIPSLREWPDALVATADDDLHYWRHWLRSLVETWSRHPGDIIAGGIHPIALDHDGYPRPYAEWGWNPPDSFPSFQNTQVAAFGALYPPRCLHPDVLDGESFLRISPSNDDFWFWAHGVRAGTRIRLVPNGQRHVPVIIPASRETPALSTLNVRGGANDRCMANLLAAYPELLARLASEPRQDVTPWGDPRPLPGANETSLENRPMDRG